MKILKATCPFICVCVCVLEVGWLGALQYLSISLIRLCFPPALQIK